MYIQHDFLMSESSNFKEHHILSITYVALLQIIYQVL